MEKYGLRAFQRRIGRIHRISGHDFTRLYTSIQTLLKSAEPLTDPSFWLHFGAISRNALTRCSFYQVCKPFWQKFYYIQSFWATRRSLGALKIAIESWESVLSDFEILVNVCWHFRQQIRSDKICILEKMHIFGKMKKHFLMFTRICVRDHDSWSLYCKKWKL